MKGVTRLRFDVDAPEVRELTSCRFWSGAASRTCLLGLALSPACARGGGRAFRFQTSSAGGSNRPAITLASSALIALSLNSLRAFRQEHNSTIAMRTNRYHIIMF